MKINGDTLSDLQAGARVQMGEARKRLRSIRGQASRALRNLATESRARGAQWTERVRQLTSIRRFRLDRWQARLMESVGLASSGQVQRINRELARLSKKIDSLSSSK
jgi:hypothetical protein